MLILVAVTINVVLETGLFDKAKEGAKDTEVEADRETLLGAVAASVDTNNDLQIPDAETLKRNLPNGWEVSGEGPYKVISANENEFRVYKNGNIKDALVLPEGENWNEDAISEIITETVDGVEYKVPIPKGYVASKATGENTVAEGLVIYEGTEEVNDSNVETAMTTRNQFVWIPVLSDFTTSYTSGTNYSEPTELTDIYSSSGAAYDSQTTLDYLLGRYETTIDENSEVGSKYNSTVLTADKKIPQTNNKTCMWYGLYNVQRNSNLIGNGDYIQTNMIWGQQWDAMLKILKMQELDYSEFGKSSQGKIVSSGESTNSSGEKDKIYNMFDLRTNCFDWTAEMYSTNNRTVRGGATTFSNSASARNYTTSGKGPATTFEVPLASRLTLYIN